MAIRFPVVDMHAPAPVNRRRTRRLARPAMLAALAGGAAGLTLAQRAHLRALADDPELRALAAPLGGHALPAVVSADGTELHAERFGADDAPATLVLAPGWTETLALWGPVIRRLAGPDLSIVAYDLRGQGASPPARTGDYSAGRFGEDLTAVLAAVDSAPARTAVAGHSLGAMSIAAWAAEHDVAARVAAVALVNTGFSELLAGSLVLGALGARLSPDWLGRLLLGSTRRTLPVSTPLSLAAVRHTAFGPDASDGIVAFYERMFIANDRHARGAIGALFSVLDLASSSARITVPTLVVGGDRDRLTPVRHARRIHEALPRPTRLLVLERTGHMSPLERPEELTGALGELLDATGVRR